MSDITDKITDENVDDMISAAESGMGYWAFAATSAEKSKATAEQVCIFVRQEDEDDNLTRVVHYLTRDDIRAAYEKLLHVDQTWVGRVMHNYFISSWHGRDENGIDAGEIDSDAGDVLLQLAAVGEVIYG